MRIARLFFTCFFLLNTLSLPAQQPVNSGDKKFIADPENALETANRTVGGLRVEQFKRVLNWYAQDSFARCRAVIDSVVHDTEGRVIVDSLSGLAEHVAGMSYYQVYDDLNAIPHYRKAIKIRDAAFPGFHANQAHTRYNLANSLHWIGRPDTATYLLREAIDIYDKLERKDSTNWLRSLKLLGVIAKEGHDPALLRSATVAMVNLLDTMQNVTDVDRYQVLYDAADNYQYINEFERSVSLAQRAIDAGEALGNISLTADAVGLLASSFRMLGKVELASETYKKSIRMLQEGKGDPTSINIGYNNLATLNLDAGDYPTALRYIQQAQEYPNNPDYPGKEAGMYVDHARILTHLGAFEEALSMYEKAMKVLTGNGIEMISGLPYMTLDSIIHLHMATVVYTHRAELLVKMDRPEAALTNLRHLFDVQNQQRARVNSDASRHLLSGEVREHYNLAIDLYYELYTTDGEEEHLWNAFTLSEEAKAYSQLAALRQNRALRGRKEQDLRRRIAYQERQSDGATELADLRLRLALIQRTEEDAGTVNAPLQSFDPAKLVAYLSQQQSDLLEYHLGDSTGYVFHLKPTGEIQMFALPANTENLLREIYDWRDIITSSAYRQKSLDVDQTAKDRQFMEVGLRLTDLLLPRLRAGNLALGTRLRIIPDGVLNLLPFAALPLEYSDVPLNYSQLKYLQSGRELQLGYSARYLLELEERTVPEFTDNLLAFAPSFQGSATAIEVGEANRLRALRSVIPEGGEGDNLPGLLPLQHNQSEVEAIASIVPGAKAYLSEAASRRAFLESIGKGRVVHISSHGLAHPQNPNLSFVAFSQDGNRLEEEELLYFNDLSTLPFQSELVVLSACETSLGKVVKGESVLSLGGAFAAAGAQSTLTSLWKVDDAATENLMVKFYEQLAAGKTRSSALAMAQESQRTEQDFAHPYYWSSMALNGQSGALKLRTNPSFFRWGIIAAMILLAGFFFWRRQ